MKSALLAVGLLVVPSLVIGGTDCRMTDLEDHVELVCVGDEKFTPLPVNVQRPAIEQRVQGETAVPAKTQAPAAARPAISPVQVKTNAVRAFQSYLQQDQQRLTDFASKKAYRQKMIQEERGRHPAPTVEEQPAVSNFHSDGALIPGSNNERADAAE